MPAVSIFLTIPPQPIYPHMSDASKSGGAVVAVGQAVKEIIHFPGLSFDQVGCAGPAAGPDVLTLSHEVVESMDQLIDENHLFPAPTCVRK
ncbi:MAG: hypothetical protein OXU79_12415 [Gemmatimonadota bacterium]|nr:hypothetical protein [Gemmatimonadota bacterium]